jgi:hypothetical protein
MRADVAKGNSRLEDIFQGDEWIGSMTTIDRWDLVLPALSIWFLHIRPGVSGWERGWLACLHRRAVGQGLAVVEGSTWRTGWYRWLKKFAPRPREVSKITTYQWDVTYG